MFAPPAGQSVNTTADNMASRLGLQQGQCFGKPQSSLRILHLVKDSVKLLRRLYTQKALNKCQFGFLFDIDGVIVRGRQPLPEAREAFKLLVHNDMFRVPVLFVTNAGNAMRAHKAQQLTKWLGIKVPEEQVVMAHSPLRMFRQFHDKHVLVNGQGPIKEIAKNIGFTRITTTQEFACQFPHLDKMDHQRGRPPPCAFEEYFPRIEAVILFGEPVRWETPLQLIIDVLLTNGHPTDDLVDIPYPHIPVLACNMDLLWMSEHKLPRLGHGCFMSALEGLYQYRENCGKLSFVYKVYDEVVKELEEAEMSEMEGKKSCRDVDVDYWLQKITGKEMKYTALIGKPSELTYHYADFLLTQQAKLLGIDHIRTIYCVGDNPETDIYGGNLYNRYLQRRKHNNVQVQGKKMRVVATPRAHADFLDEDNEDESEDTLMFQSHSGANLRVIRSLEEDTSGVEKAHGCESILVCTGVFNASTDFVTVASNRLFSHNHRDFVIDPTLTTPSHVVSNVLEAVKLIFEKEKYS